jgi:RimJ/RimL family protein N-acetyltransferase
MDDAVPQPIFETERLVLHPRRLGDTEACLAMDREAGVTRFVDGPWGDPVPHRAFIEARTRGPYPAGLGYWTIRQRDRTDGFLGWVLLIPEDAVGPDVEIGWRLRPQAWGRGFATEAAGPLLRHAFARLRLTQVIAEIHADNRGSQRVAEKLGMTLDARYERDGWPTLRYRATAAATGTGA